MCEIITFDQQKESLFNFCFTSDIYESMVDPLESTLSRLVVGNSYSAYGSEWLCSRTKAIIDKAIDRWTKQRWFIEAEQRAKTNFPTWIRKELTEDLAFELLTNIKEYQTF